MSGENNFISKAVGLFMDMDDMIGDDYERGLALLDEAARNAAGDPDTGAEPVAP